MFKQISKTLLIAIVSGVLTTSPVLAQSTTQPVVKTDAQGNKSASETHKFSKVEDNDMLASITMLAIGVIGARLFINYKAIDATDIMIAAAGAAAFIAGEVMSTMSFKKGIEETTMEIVKKKGTPNQEQITALQKLKESYEGAKKTLKTKKTMQMAAAAAFGAAAAMALYKSFNEVAADALCRGAIKTSQAALKACIASGSTGVGAAAAAHCSGCQVNMGLFEGLFTKYTASRLPPATPSIGKKAEVTAEATQILVPLCPGGAGTPIAEAASKACSAAVKVNQTGEGAGPIVNSGSSGNMLFPKTQMYVHALQPSVQTPFDTFMDFFFPRTYAGMMSLLGLGAGAAASFFLISGPLAVQVDSMMFVARNRAIVYAALAAGAFMASKSTDNVLKKIEENIAKIDKILAELNNMGKGIATQGLKPVRLGMEGLFPPTQTIASISPDGKEKFPCAIGSANASKCPSMEEQLKNIPGFSQMPPALQVMASDSSKLADGINGRTGITGATMNRATALANKRSAINNLLKRTQQNLNDRLRKAGKAPIDFDKEQGKFFNGAAASVKKSLAKSGNTAGGMLASIGGSPIDSSGMGKPMEEEGSPKVPTATYGSAGGAPAPADNMDMNFEDPTEGALADGAAAVEEQAVYDMGNQDEIHKDTGPSIFELISSRYLKSGYSKLLEEEPTTK